MINLPYSSIPAIPEEVSSTNIIARFIDAVGFRYRWATEGLTENEIQFQAIEGSMTMNEVLNHIYDLALITNRTFVGGQIDETRPITFQELRSKTLSIYSAISKHLKTMDDEKLNEISSTPFWYFLNGPIADALTHIGQITSWRRIAGNPQPKGVNPFKGTKQ